VKPHKMAIGECDVDYCTRFSADLAYCPEHTPEVDYEIEEEVDA